MILAFVLCLEELSNCCKYFVLNSDKWSNILHHHSLTHCTVWSEGVTSFLLSLGNSYNQRGNLYKEKFCLIHFSLPFKCHFILLGVHSPILPSPLSTLKKIVCNTSIERNLSNISRIYWMYLRKDNYMKVLRFSATVVSQDQSINMKIDSWFRTLHVVI